MVLDTEVGGIARRIDSPHERMIHSIALPRPSVFAQVGSDCFNYFATASSDNSVNIWDVRVPRCTGRYTSHVNRREEVQCCLSPCLRYLGIGSEDKTARIVDLRTGKEMAKLQGFKDVVSAIAFNPLFPQLAVGSFDGQIKYYSC
jgi:WD40 repeat protein